MAALAAGLAGMGGACRVAGPAGDAGREEGGLHAGRRACEDLLEALRGQRWEEAGGLLDPLVAADLQAEDIRRRVLACPWLQLHEKVEIDEWGELTTSGALGTPWGRVDFSCHHAAPARAEPADAIIEVVVAGAPTFR